MDHLALVKVRLPHVSPKRCIVIWSASIYAGWRLLRKLLFDNSPIGLSMLSYFRIFFWFSELLRWLRSPTVKGDIVPVHTVVYVFEEFDKSINDLLVRDNERNELNDKFSDIRSQQLKNFDVKSLVPQTAHSEFRMCHTLITFCCWILGLTLQWFLSIAMQITLWRLDIASTIRNCNSHICWKSFRDRLCPMVFWHLPTPTTFPKCENKYLHCFAMGG